MEIAECGLGIGNWDFVVAVWGCVGGHWEMGAFFFRLHVLMEGVSLGA